MKILFTLLAAIAGCVSIVQAQTVVLEPFGPSTDAVGASCFNTETAMARVLVGGSPALGRTISFELVGRGLRFADGTSVKQGTSGADGVATLRYQDVTRDAFSDFIYNFRVVDIASGVETYLLQHVSPQISPDLNFCRDLYVPKPVSLELLSVNRATNTAQMRAIYPTPNQDQFGGGLYLLDGLRIVRPVDFADRNDFIVSIPSGRTSFSVRLMRRTECESPYSAAVDLLATDNARSVPIGSSLTLMALIAATLAFGLKRLIQNVRS